MTDFEWFTVSLKTPAPQVKVCEISPRLLGVKVKVFHIFPLIMWISGSCGHLSPSALSNLTILPYIASYKSISIISHKIVDVAYPRQLSRSPKLLLSPA